MGTLAGLLASGAGLAEGRWILRSSRALQGSDMPSTLAKWQTGASSMHVVARPRLLRAHRPRAWTTGAERSAPPC